MIYFSLFLYLLVWFYFCKSKTTRSVHFPQLLNMLKQVLNYFQKCFILDVCERVLNMLLTFFSYSKPVKILSFHVTVNLSLWKPLSQNFHILSSFRHFLYGGELARLGGLAHLGEISPSLRKSCKNIMCSYGKWARPPRWAWFCQDPT